MKTTINHTNDTARLITGQYADQHNLDARIRLHEVYGVAPMDWHCWVFDHLRQVAGPDAVVLEVGCGTGSLWQKNLKRVPPGWRVTLSDASPGMVADARANLGDDAGRFAWLEADALSLPLPTASVDVLIANHMIYHLPDMAAGIQAFRRVLKPGGTLFAATNGAAHMAELDDLLHQMALDEGLVTFLPKRSGLRFRLENGADLLGACFASVQREDFPSYLQVTAAQPVVDYVLSMNIMQDFAVPQAWLDALTQRVQAIIDRDGAFRIQRASGLFIAH